MKNLATALVAFRSECPAIKRTKKNPHFKNMYAPLETIREVVDPILAKHGLVVMQFPVSDDAKAGVVTRVMHTSGEFLEETFLLPLAKNDPQGACSAVTYARRYGLSGALGLVTEDDDDGNSASGLKPIASEAVRRLDEQPAPRSTPKASPAMSEANRDKVKHAAGVRVKELGDDSISAAEIIKDVARMLAYDSPAKVKDIEFGRMLELVQKWEPGGAL